MRLLLFLILLLPSVLFAESPIFTCKNGAVMKPAEAKLYLVKTQDAYSKVDTLKAEFSQESYLAALDTSEISSGKLSFSKPGRMKWEYEKPEEQIFLIVDTTLWFYQALDKQVVVDKFSKFLISDLPVAFVLGLGDLQKSFDIQSACTNLGGDGIFFSLTPKSAKAGKGNSDDRLSKFELVVDSVDFLPRAARIYDIASNINTFYLKEQEVNKAIDLKIYEPVFPRGTDIDDRRRGE